MLSFYLPSAAVFYLSFMYLYFTFSFVLSPVLLSFFLFSIAYLISHYRKTNAKLLQNCCKIATKMQHDCYKNTAWLLQSCCNVTTKLLQRRCKAEQSHYNFESKLCDYRTLGFNYSNIVELKLSIDSMYLFFLFFYFSNFRELWSYI